MTLNPFLLKTKIDKHKIPFTFFFFPPLASTAKPHGSTHELLSTGCSETEVLDNTLDKVIHDECQKNIGEFIPLPLITDMLELIAL